MDSLPAFEKFVPYLKDPLVLVGFVTLLFFGLGRTVIKSGVLQPVSGVRSYRVLQTILLYGFLVGVLIVLLGFGLKYRELSEAEQRRTVELLKGEFNANIATVEALRKNSLTVLQALERTSKLLRDTRIPVLSTMFSSANLSSNAPPPKDVAISALTELVNRGLDRNKSELAKADAAARAIRTTLDRTRDTMVSLADPEHRRYTLSDKTWNAHLSFLQKIHLKGVPEFQEAYSHAERLRADYDVVMKATLAYFDALSGFFDRNHPVDIDRLASILTLERQVFSLTNTYAKSVLEKLERFQDLQRRLDAVTPASP